MQSAPTKLRHVEERLAERAPPAAAERGFALLRDRAALARFLARQRRQSDALASADRIALPLAPGDGAPHILVTPDGKGVTCLGPGMAFAAPKVPFAEVKRHLDEEQERLRAEITLRRVQRGPEASSPITRLIRYPHRVTREEFLALRELTPILLRFYRKVVREEVTFFFELLQRRRRLPKKRAHRAVFFRLYYSAAIALMAAGHDEGMFRLLLAAAWCGDTLLAPRALWHLVHQPERTLARAEEAKDLFEGNFDLYGDFVLPAIAARFPAWRKDTAATLNRLARGTPQEEEARQLAPKLLELDPENRNLWQGLLFALPFALSRIAPPQLAERDFQACLPAMQAKAEEAGASFFDLARIMGPFVEARAKEMRILEGLRAPVRLLPRSERELDDEERLRIQNYRAVWLGTKTPLARCYPVLPILVASTPIEAITPSDDPRRDLSPSDCADYIGNVLPEVLQAYAGMHQPVEATEKSPGRNAPCPCGSGQKYKRCCGAA